MLALARTTRGFLALAIASAVCLLMLASVGPASPVARAEGDLILYDDALQNGFQDWGWAPHSYANSDPVYDGIHSASVSYAGNYDGLYIASPSLDIDTSAYTALRFAIHGGGAGGQTMQVKAGGGTGYPANAVGLSDFLPGGPVAGSWRVVTIPLSALNMANTGFSRLAFQSDVAGSQSTFYLDDIRLVAGAPPPAPGANGTIRIEANGVVTPVDSRLLGTNLPAWLGPGSFASTTFRARADASGVSLIRMPGGSWSNAYDWLACENGDDSGCYWTWASRPSDFINFVRAAGRPGLYTVNPNDTSKKAAALVAFFNSRITDTTPIGVDIRGTDWYTAGHWAQLRAAHGNPEPLGVRLWEIGNEVYGGKPGSGGSQCLPWGWEDVWTCDGTEYVLGVGSGSSRHEGYLEFRAAMRAVDPAILVGAVGVPFSATWNNWGNEVIAAAGDNLDFYVIHQYAYFLPPSYAAALAEPQFTWRQILSDVNEAFDTHAGGRRAPIAVTEYNLFSTWNQDNSQMMTRAVNLLFIADTLGQIIQNGVAMANQWDLSNGGPSGNGADYGLLGGGGDGFTRYPQYYAFPLWARFGSQMLPVTSTFSAASQLSVYAGRVNSSTLSLLAINKTGNPVTATIHLADAPAIIGGSADVASATSLNATSVTFNDVSNPSHSLSNAPPLPLGSTGNPVNYTFAPNSVTLLRFNYVSPELSQRVYLPVLLKQ